MSGRLHVAESHDQRHGEDLSPSPCFFRVQGIDHRENREPQEKEEDREQKEGEEDHGRDDIMPRGLRLQ